MNHTDLKKLLDNIQSDSMSRDEIFFESGKGSLDRKTMFFEYLRELKSYFDMYLEHEDRIMEDDGEDYKDGFGSIVKNVNDTYRNIVNN